LSNKFLNIRTPEIIINKGLVNPPIPSRTVVIPFIVFAIRLKAPIISLLLVIDCRKPCQAVLRFVNAASIPVAYCAYCAAEAAALS
jgi:hypothetical protein